MPRRPIIEEPLSRLAVWSSRFGWFALAVAALSVVIVRSGFLETGPSLVTFAAALVLAVLAILSAIAGAVAIWRQGLTGIGRLATGFLLGVALLAYPGYLATRAYRLPAINDIVTDPANPPKFDVIARLRPRGTNEYPGAATAQKQQAAYPDIAPLQVLRTPKAAFDTALALVTKRKWSIIDARAPAPGRAGIIEAVARTPVMGFRDDVVIRVAQVGTGAQIDMRSASRYGAHDFGANAARVRAFMEELDDLTSSPAPEPRGEQDRKPAPARPGGRPQAGKPEPAKPQPARR